MAQFKSKKAIVDTLKQQIQSNPKQAVRALLRIYENQNESEREHQCTMFKDGYGFTQNDAEFGSSLAEQYLEKKVPDSQANGSCPENDAEIRQADRRAEYCFREDCVR